MSPGGGVTITGEQESDFRDDYLKEESVTEKPGDGDQPSGDVGSTLVEEAEDLSDPLCCTSLFCKEVLMVPDTQNSTMSPCLLMSEFSLQSWRDSLPPPIQGSI